MTQIARLPPEYSALGTELALWIAALVFAVICIEIALELRRQRKRRQ